MASEVAAAVAATVNSNEGAPVAEVPVAATPKTRTLASTLEDDAAPPPNPEAEKAAAEAKAKEIADKKAAQDQLRKDRKELIALRQAKAADYRRKQELAQQAELLKAQKEEIERLRKQIEADPFEHAAKSRGKTRLQMLEEENYRTLNEGKAKKEDEDAAWRARVEKLEKEREEERTQRDEQFKKWESERKVAAFHEETRKAMESAKRELVLVHTWPSNVVEGEVLSRMDKHYRATGERLDRTEVLRKIESELRADLKAKREALEAAERPEETPGDPDRSNGAVTSPRGPEATANPEKGPQTLTQSLASQTAGRVRKRSDKDRNIEADKLLGFG